MKRLIAVIGVILLCAGASPAFSNGGEDGVLMVWDYDEGYRSEMGGFDHDFERAPSSARFSLQREVRRGSSGRALRLDYNKESSGWVGYWLHLFKSDAPLDEREYLDVSDYKYLSFHVRSDDLVSFEIKLGDEYWVQQEDSVSAGTVDRYLPLGFSDEWREVLVPLENFRGLDLTRMGVFSINILSEGEGTIYIDDICFKKEREIPTPLSAGIDPAPIDFREYSNAVWVWFSDRLLFSPGYRRDFFANCEAYGIKEVFFQMLYRHHDPWTNHTTTELLHTEELADFIREAHEHGLKIHALDGYPPFVLAQNHQMVLSQIDAVIAYNESVPPESRYDGVHLDNEPYQLIGFAAGTLMEEITLQFLDLNTACMERVEGTGIEYGIDIPFWMEGLENGEPRYSITWNGKTQDATFHILDSLHNVGIMDYRNEATGADGVIRHGAEEIRYADQVGTDIYIGLETIEFPEEPVVYVVGYPRDEFDKILIEHRQDVAYEWQWYGNRMHFFEGPDGRVHMGVQRPITWASEAQKDEWWEHFAVFAQIFGVDYSALGEQEQGWEAVDVADQMVLDPNSRFVTEPETDLLTVDGKQYLVIDISKMEFPKVTFHGTDPDLILEVMAQTAEEFRESPSFRGFAIHFYEPFILYRTGSEPVRYEDRTDR